MVKLPRVRIGEGLSIEEMVQVATRINPKSWVSYDFLRDDYPYEYKTLGLLWHERDEYWFGYDFSNQDQGLDVYLSNNSQYSWSSQIALRIMKGNVTLGFTGRIKKVHCQKILLDLCSYVKDCAENNTQTAIIKWQERQKTEVEKVREIFRGENI